MGRGRKTLLIFAGILPVLCSAMCEGKSGGGAASPVLRITPRIIRTIPHDGNAFTQGLCFKSGVLYESDGLYGESALRTLDTGGTVIVKRNVAPTVFAEGCAFLDGRIFQLTWREQRCYVYSAPGLAPADSVPYGGEGWGLCTAEGRLVMSNGTDTLYTRNRQFALAGKTAVTCEGKPLPNLNELEYARGRIFANVWYSDFIFEINPQSGAVERIVDCGEIVRQENPSSPDYVLNGIAYRPDNGLFYITGKKWKNIYIVEIPAP